MTARANAHSVEASSLHLVVKVAGAARSLALDSARRSEHALAQRKQTL